jgi:Fe-only nitrogenase accessory protein AnfO
MKIATYVNNSGEVVSFYEKGSVRLYDQISGLWTKKKEFPLEMHTEMNVPEVRVKLRMVVNELEDCKVFLAADVKGVPYAILEGMGFNIWKSSGSVNEQLDFVAQKEQDAIEAANKPKPTPLPVGDIRDGFFQINLQEILNSHPTLSSQQILIPFMEKTAFQKLEIICDHTPRWLAREFERLNLRFEAEALGGGCGHLVKITVFSK